MLQTLKIVNATLFRHGISVLLMGVTYACLSSTVARANDDLKIRVSIPNNGRIRSHATLPIEIDIKWNNDRLLEGYVEITFREASNAYEERQTFYTYRTPDLALSFGEKKLGALLPTTPLKQSQGGLLTYDLKFVGTEESIPFGTSTLIAPTVHEQRLLIGVVLSDPTIPEERIPFVAPLHFENVFVNNRKSVNQRRNAMQSVTQRINAMRNASANPLRNVITRTHRIDVMELPPSALKLCAYDLLVIADDAFPKLSAKQLDALATWIEAGGNILIELASNGCNRAHVDFLNRLADSLETAERPFLEMEQGRIDMVDGDHDPTWDNGRGFQAGLGRAVVFEGRLTESINSSQDGKQLADLVGSYLWHARTAVRLSDNDSGTGNDSAKRLSDALNTALMPDSVRSVPASSVIVMLLVFLLAISVGDYFLLGLIDKRTWTWVLFPLISLCFTGYTIWMARYYMGARDFTTAVTIIDTDAQGRVLRSNRIEMVFTATERVSTTKVRNAIYATLSNELTPPPEIPRVPSINARGRVDSTGFMQGTQAAPPVCIGQLPAVYSIERSMRKWTPQIGRYTTLGSESQQEFPEFSWNVADWEQLLQPQVFDAWKARVVENYGDCDAGLISPGQQRIPQQPDALGRNSRWQAVWQFVADVSTNDKRGMFAAASRISPTGSVYLNDLATLDSTNASSEFVALVIIRRGDEFFVFRHTHFGRYLP